MPGDSMPLPLWQSMLLLLLGGSGGASILRGIQYLITRKRFNAKADAEINESQARTRASDTESFVSTGRIVVEMVAELREASTRIRERDDIIAEKDDEIFALRKENELLQGEKVARQMLERELDKIKQERKI